MKPIGAAIVALSLAFAVDSFGSSLSGQVIESSTENRLANVLVTVNVLIPDSIPFWTMSNAEGLYTVTDIIPNNEIYVITAYKAGYKSFYFRYDELASKDVLFDIVLEEESTPPIGGGEDSTFLAGQILGRDNSSSELTPVAGAKVRLASGGGEYIFWTETNGRYEATIPRGSYSISVSASGYETSVTTGVTAGSAGLSYGTVLHQAPTEVDDNGGSQPVAFVLAQNYPNPFNPATIINYSLPSTSRVKLEVFNVLGRRVALLEDGKRSAGDHIMEWDASDYPSGIYFYRLTYDGGVATRKMVLLK